jgi:hypothetical protein
MTSIIVENLHIGLTNGLFKNILLTNEKCYGTCGRKISNMYNDDTCYVYSSKNTMDIIIVCDICYNAFKTNVEKKFSLTTGSNSCINCNIDSLDHHTEWYHNSKQSTTLCSECFGVFKPYFLQITPSELAYYYRLRNKTMVIKPVPVRLPEAYAARMTPERIAQWVKCYKHIEHAHPDVENLCDWLPITDIKDINTPDKTSPKPPKEPTMLPGLGLDISQMLPEPKCMLLINCNPASVYYEKVARVDYDDFIIIQREFDTVDEYAQYDIRKNTESDDVCSIC